MPCDTCGLDATKKKHPWTCLLEVLKDASIIAGTYAVLALTLENTKLTWDGTLTFLALFVPLAFFVKIINCEYSDQLPRVALFHLSTKLFNVLTS